MAKIVDINSRRNFREQRKIAKRLKTADTKQEMNDDGKTTVFEGSHIITESDITNIPRFAETILRFLKKLTERERAKLQHLVENITLDARVKDRSFTCTMMYLRASSDPEILKLYGRMRAAIFVHRHVMLPEFSSKDLVRPVVKPIH